jgi:cyclophilin family peptidyl-prolyl cis-trans isomerase
MSNEKRARQRANRMERLEAEHREEARRKRTKLIVRWSIIIVVVLGAALAYSLLADDGSDDTVATADPTSTTEARPVDTALPDRPDCPAEDGSSAATLSFAAPPQLCIDPGTLYAADFATSEGDFTVVLDPELDVASVNNFIVLARYHAYDGTTFHRVIDGFVIQGGDVENGYGLGGPGYRFTGAFPPEDEPYRIGSLAMANTGNPSTNGSQFFIITGEDGAALPANYSLMGRVTEGIDVPLAIQETPTEVRDTDRGGIPDVPVTDVVVESVTIREAAEDEITAYESVED